MRLVSLWVAALLTLGLALPGHAAEASPHDVIQSFSNVLLDVMKNAKTLGFEGRRKKLEPAVAQAYDMTAMTQGALGPASRKLSPEELARLSDAFARYNVATYAQQFDGYDGERFDVGEAKPSTGGNMLVPSQIVPRTGNPTEIDYVMYQTAEGWRIVDVLLEGTVSQVAVRRSEFSSIYRRDGLDGLVNVIDQKTAALK